MHLAEATLTAVCSVALASAAPIVGPLLADAGAAPDLGSWGQVASTIVSTGFAVWYAYWVTTKTLPEKDKLHREAIAELVADFRAESQESRDAFRQSLADIKATFRCQGVN